jgi:beta-glucosidase
LSLRGFSRVSLAPGQTQHVTVTLAARSFQYWANNAWTNAAGTSQVYVGASSRDIRLTGQVTIGGSTAQVVSFRAHADGDYVTADNAGASPLIANRTAIGPWETFDMVDEGNGNVALRAHANGEYVCADNAGASPLIANRAAVGSWETFGLIHNADGSVSLQAKANNDYVTAENAGASALIANRTAIGPWEEFDLIND